MAYKQYSDKKKAEVLAQLATNKGDATKTAKQTGVERTTIIRWAKRGMPDYTEVIDVIDDKLNKLLDEMPDFSKAPHAWPNAVRELVKARQLLAGQPTERTESKNANMNLNATPLGGLTQSERDELLKRSIQTLWPERDDLHGKRLEELDPKEKAKLLEKSLAVMRQNQEPQKDERFLEEGR